MQAEEHCDIVIPIWNAYELTKSCIESIINNTFYPYRVIAIDNGSEEPTKSYLEALRYDKRMKFTLIHNEENLGFVKAVNQGMRLSNAEYTCVLNNDTLVADRWLSIMVDVMKRNPSIGLLNPLSNTFGRGPKEIEGLNNYAHSIRDKRNRFVEAGQCIGFCMLIKKDVVDRVGYLSEDSKFMFFEDTDYSIRARNSGFICAIAMGAYVYHYEHKSADRLKLRQKEIFDENQRLFYKKWGRPLRIVYISSTDFRNDKKLAKRRIEEAISISKKGNYVYLFQHGGFKGDLDDFYESLGLIRFLNAQIFFKDRFFRLYCVRRILTRRKKRFAAVFVDDPALYRFLKKTCFLHRAELYHEPREEDLRGLWRKRWLF